MPRQGSTLFNLGALLGSAARIKAALEALTGDDRLDASAIKNLPSGDGADQSSWAASAPLSIPSSGGSDVTLTSASFTIPANTINPGDALLLYVQYDGANTAGQSFWLEIDNGTAGVITLITYFNTTIQGVSMGRLCAIGNSNLFLVSNENDDSLRGGATATFNTPTFDRSQPATVQIRLRTQTTTTLWHLSCRILRNGA